MTRVAIVTGGTRGTGEAISVALKHQGATVAANYAGNDARAKEFSNRTEIATYKWAVSDRLAYLDGVAKDETDLCPVDIVINNAGITHDKTIIKMSYEAWDDVIRTNLGGCFSMAKATFAGMTEQGWGRIVNIVSVNGQSCQYG